MVYTDKIHLVADSLEELHKFAFRIGMKQSWFQGPPKASHPHYDLKGKMIGHAINSGAQVVGREEILRFAKKLLNEFRRHKMDAEEKAIFEWQYRLMGDFRKALMEAICRADEDNLELLKSVYPNEVNGYIKYSLTSGWWQKVENKAEKTGYRSTTQ